MKALWPLGLLLLAGCQADASSQGVPQPDAALPGTGVPDLAQALDEHLARGDHRLIIRAGRGQMAPGIAAEQQQAAKVRCGTRYLTGLVDMVRPGEEARQQALTEFAAEYNRQMLGHCPSDEEK
ncbi:hypothetical protein ACEUBT_10040 [Aeromonas bivalvium]|uniref:hypothetical protein n=1 Tax=Aeromonas bivalvium TaxID=440079 RepID=UPI0038D16480